MLCSAQAALAVFAVALALSLAFTLHRAAHAPYQCEMTYMWPRYEPVTFSRDHGSRNRLLLYREGGIPAHAAGRAPCVS